MPAFDMCISKKTRPLNRMMHLSGIDLNVVLIIGGESDGKFSNIHKM